MSYRVAADIGGTFTDIALLAGDGRRPLPSSTLALRTGCRGWARLVPASAALPCGAARLRCRQFSPIWNTDEPKNGLVSQLGGTSASLSMMLSKASIPYRFAGLAPLPATMQAANGFSARWSFP